MTNLLTEKKMRKLGYKVVTGLDEVGRGSLAGPVVAVAVTIMRVKKGNRKYDLFWIEKNKDIFADVKDSKMLREKKREEVCRILENSPAIKWGIGKVFPKAIDKINILEATKLAMARAVANLEKKVSQKTDCLIIDGRIKIKCSHAVFQKAIVKADEKVFSCSAASIIAKVKRDSLMRRYHKDYPQYGFAKHKGYGTKFHFAALKKYGPCKIHRKTFEPIKSMW